MFLEFVVVGYRQNVSCRALSYPWYMYNWGKFILFKQKFKHKHWNTYKEMNDTHLLPIIGPTGKHHGTHFFT